MSGPICLRCRESLRQSFSSKRLARISISISRSYLTSEAPRETSKEAAKETSTEASSNRFIPRSVLLYGTRIATPLSSKPEDQSIPLRRVHSRKIVNKEHQNTNIDDLLSKPTWSVQSLSPFKKNHKNKPAEEVSVEQLHHLCRLSALPLPKTPEEEKKLLDTLHLQLHFLKHIQNVDTTGVEPLRSIRDETPEAEAEESIGLDTEEIKQALAKEEYEGRNKRPRRRIDGVVDTRGVEDWDVTGTATENVEFGGGKYFIVRSGKGPEINQGAVESDHTEVKEEVLSDVGSEEVRAEGEN